MYRLRVALLLAIGALHVLADTLPTSAGCAPDSQFTILGASSGHVYYDPPSLPTSPAHKVAIIGAGPGGTSAAYFLSKANEELRRRGVEQQGFEIDVYERNRVGGRTSVVKAWADQEGPARETVGASLEDDAQLSQYIELGASIFADVNRNLKRSAKSFGLHANASLGEPGGLMGIWDGQQFVIEGLDDGWWNSARMLWRYGYSPVTTKKLVGKLVARFLRLYDPVYLHKPNASSRKQPNATDSGFPWSTIQALSDALEFSDLVATDAGDNFYAQGVSKLFVEEIIEAATLVNYGQEIYSIHALGGGVSLAASGATGITGGNYQIFSEMLRRSSAKLRLGQSGEVTGIVKFGSIAEVVQAGHLSWAQVERSEWIKETGTKWWVGTKTGGGGLYDSVFIATPWHNAAISLMNTHADIPTPPYVHLHVTLLITNASHPNPAYFRRGKSDAVPTSILTTHAALRKAKKQKGEGQSEHGNSDRYLHFSQDSSLALPLRIYSYVRSLFRSGILGWWPGGDGKDEGPILEFNSLSYLKKLPPRNLTDGSAAGDEHVVKIFSKAALNDTQLESIMGTNNVRWVFRKEWDAYPELRPTRDFPPLQADEEGLYFLNSFETLISTMETSTVSARNAVALLLQKTLGWDFVHGGKKCSWKRDGKAMRAQDGPEDAETDSEAWAGWGCNSA